MEANSETVTNSVSFNTFSCNSASNASCSRRCKLLSLLALLFLDPLDLEPVFDKRANVSLISF